MLPRRAATPFALAVAIFGLLCLLDRFQPLIYQRLHHLSADAIARLGRTALPDEHLVFLAIDSDSVGLEEETDAEQLYELHDQTSIEARAFKAMTHRFPWPRETYALIVERLVKAGAKVVAFDLTFPTPTDGDEPFRLALERYRDHVIIGSNFVDPSWSGLARVGAAHTRPPDSLVPQTTPMDARVAFTNFWPDADDVVRRANYRVTFEQIQGLSPDATSEQFLSLAGRALEKAGYPEAVPAGLGDQTFRYAGSARAGFPPRSVFEIFVPEYWQRNYKNGEFFRDKIVLIGAEGNWQHDEHRTPFGSMPGPEIHLNAMNAALQGEFIRELPAPGVLGVVLLAGLLAVVLTLGVGSPWLRLLALLGANGALVWLALQAYNHLNLSVPCLPGLLELNGTVLLGTLADFTRERLERKRVRRTLEKYVSRNVVRELLDQPASFQESLGGVIKPVAVLFSDIRGYTALGAQTDPHALVSQLNEYLTAMVAIVFRHGGTLDKFIGDALMAVWGNVRTEGTQEDASSAVRAALEMRAELVRLNAAWRTRGLPELRIGLAINQGDVVVGNIGSAERMEFTVIGDVVNVTWKLQELTKKAGADLIISRSVRGLVQEEFEVTPLPPAMVSGHNAPLEIFAVRGAIEVGDGAAVGLHPGQMAG